MISLLQVGPLANVSDHTLAIRAVVTKVNEVINSLGSYALLDHNHDDRYYLKAAVDQLLVGKAAAVHNHNDLYYTKTEVDAKLATKSPLVHDHDSRYYTQAEIDARFASLTVGSSSSSSDFGDLLAAGAGVPVGPANQGKIFEQRDSGDEHPLWVHRGGRWVGWAGFAGEGDGALAIGRLAFTGETHSLAVGVEAAATGDSTIALGWQARADQVYGIAVGTTSYANKWGVGIGGEAQAAGEFSTAVGPGAVAKANEAVSIGPFVFAGSQHSVSMGYTAYVDPLADYGIAIGDGAHVEGYEGVALGEASTVYAAEGTALGSNTLVNYGHDNSVALGQGSFSTGPNQVAINQRQLVSLLPVGTPPFDVQSTDLNVNLNADMLDGYHAAGLPYLPLTGGILSGPGNLRLDGVLTSTVVTGTAPFVVASTTKVVNLNADLLDGLDSSAFALAGSGAPTAARYLTLLADATLTQERVLTMSAEFTTADGGAGGNFSVSVNSINASKIAAGTFGAGTFQFQTRLDVKPAANRAYNFFTISEEVGGNLAIVNSLIAGGAPDPTFWFFEDVSSDGRQRLRQWDAGTVVNVLQVKGSSGIIGYGNGALSIGAGISATFGESSGRMILPAALSLGGVQDIGDHYGYYLATPDNTLTGYGTAGYQDLATYVTNGNTWSVSRTRPGVRYTGATHLFRVDASNGQNNPGTDVLELKADGSGEFKSTLFVDSILTAYSNVRSEVYGAAATVGIRRANGTLALPTVVLAGQIIGSVTYNGYDTTGLQTGAVVRAIVGASDFGAANRGTYLSFLNALEGSTVAAERWRINSTAGDLVPGADSTYYLGSSSLRLAGIFTAGPIYSSNYGPGNVLVGSGILNNPVQGLAVGATSTYLKVTGPSSIGWSAIDAADVTTGTFAIGRIPNIPAANVTAGTFGAGGYTFPSTLAVTTTLTVTGQITINRDGGASNNVIGTSYGGFALASLRRAEGTLALPTFTPNATIVSRYAFAGYDGAAFQTVAGVDAITTEDTGATFGASLRFLTVKTGASAIGVRWSIDGSGFWVPAADNTYSIGTGALRVKDIQFAGTLTGGSADAALIATGSFAAARLGTGTADSTTVLYGDQTFKKQPWYAQRLQGVFKVPNGSGWDFVGVASNQPVTLTNAFTNDETQADNTWSKWASGAVSGNSNGFSVSFGANVQWLPDVTIIFGTDANINNVGIWAGLFASALAPENNYSPSSHYVALRYYTQRSSADATAVDGTAFWRVVHMDGVTQGVTTSSVAVAASTKYTARFVFSSSTACKVYVNGTLVDTIAANLPATSQVLSARVSITTFAAAAKTIRGTAVWCLQN